MGKRVTVIGAGVVGLACAAELQRRGHDVTLLDPRPPGEGCSFGNAGCQYDSEADVPLSARQRAAIARIAQDERDLGCPR